MKPLPLGILPLFLLSPGLCQATVIAANFQVVQNDDGNNATSVSGSFGWSTGGIQYVGGSRGDFGFRFNGATPAADVANGIMIASISQNGRSNQGTTVGSGLGYATPAIQSPGNLGTPNPSYAGYSSSINVGNTAVTGIVSGDEWNVNHAVGYFNYSGFLGGWVTNSANNGAMTGFVSSSAGLTVGSGTTDPGTFTVFDNTGTDGIYTLRLGSLTAPGTGTAATSQNGVLLTVGGKNEDNYALASANADGSFSLICRDNGADAFNYENDPVGFVYVPVGQAGVVAMGRIDNEGDAVANSGNFTVGKGGTGQWYLTTPGYDPTNSTLLLSPEGADVSGTLRADNMWSYQYDSANNRWVIEDRDISATATANPTLQNLAPNEPAFSFVLVPEPSSGLLGLGGLLVALRRRRQG